MKIFGTTLALLFCSISLWSQTYTLSGIVQDDATGEPLIGATITSGEAGTVTDFDGGFSIELPAGSQEVTFSYVAYSAKTETFEMDGNKRVEINLEGMVLNEVVVVADIAKERETPVAFSTIPSIKLKEELASQDLPMILNSTPGAYATQSGGGDGDARVTIRGFNQRNVAVMIDGVPVNDMENGWVYWSNWFGLDLVTQTMQVQRGLGASKLSIPSIGGTINILTRGIDAKKTVSLKQEVGNNGYTRSDIALSSGRLKSGWAFSGVASYKRGDGWVDGTYTEGVFYYLRIDKQLGNHLISLQGYGAPQKHGQRAFTTAISVTDTAYARDLGFTDEDIFSNDNYLGIDRGRRYNQHWGMLNGELYNTASNYYHKPQISLRHSWQANEKLFWSNVAYLSLGNGGGTGTEGRFSNMILPNGQINLDSIVKLNQRGTFLKPEGKSERIIRTSVNNHFWTGILSTLQYDWNKNLKISGGIDGRYYRGDHYREVYDLLGGDYFTGVGNLRIDQAQARLVEGDRYDYNNSGFVSWMGGFALAEWKNERWSVFANVSSAVSGYKLVDYFKPKVVNIADTTVYVSYNSDAVVNGTTYTLDSPEAQNQTIDWVYVPTYTFKAGASYKINKQHSVFFNTGYLSKAQRFTNVINDSRNNPRQPIKVFSNYDNEIIQAVELGYSFSSPVFSANLNAYYTNWENKPLDFAVQAPLPDNPEETVPVNIPGIDALHQGIELDFAYKPTSRLTIEGLASVGDWIWNSANTATITIPEQNTEITYDFNAEGVHVGGAAQLQFGGMIRYEPIKDWYVKVKGTWFGRNFSDFQPENLRGENEGRESWQMPDYFLMDVHTGYYFKVNKWPCSVRLNILNVLDATYISDAQNNDTRAPGITETNFDAPSASVHFGQGLRWNASFQISF
jgi:hypothetical protein